MSDELRAAAERLATNHDRRYWRQSGIGDLFPYDPAIDGPKVARAYLAEHPADDAEPTDETFVRSVAESSLPKEPEEGDMVCHWLNSVVFLYCDPNDKWYACTLADHSPEMTWHEFAEVPTRGHVRRLASALGIALKDSA